jgi:glycosyltransferase involved in cell wall biosynthesis
MRVLLYRSHCDTGGVSSIMLLLGRHLARRGIECEYWFCRSSNRFAEFQETGAATLGPIPPLARRLDRGDFDVVHIPSTDPAGALVSRLAGSARVVVTSHGAIADIWHRRNCHAYTAVSKGMATLNQPYTDLEIELVRNAIEVSKYEAPAAPAPTGGPIVAFVGRTTALEKDFPRFTRIARRLATRGVRIWIADPHEASLQKFDGQAVEQIDVERWGRVPHDEMPDFYRAIAASGGLLLITSISEGFGSVAPEAAACGARVAATDVIGLREAVVDGVTGMLFPAEAPDADVAARLDAWLAAPHDMVACADAAKREFSPSVMVDGYLSIFERGEQRVVRAPAVRSADEPEVGHLLRHLEQQRRWRARFSRGAAVDLAGAGFRREAMAALGIAFRAAPLEFLAPVVARQLLSVGKRVASRRPPP